MKVVISSGHGKYVRGASGYIDEVDEARRVTEAVAAALRAAGVDVVTYHDDVSHSQSENLNRIVDFHNAQTRELDVSVHFNAYTSTQKPMGCEVCFLTQEALAADVSAAIAQAGQFIDRGAKKRTDLAFLNGTEQTRLGAILIETCFVDSAADTELYGAHFAAICTAIAATIAGEDVPERPPMQATAPPLAMAPPTLGHGDRGSSVALVQGYLRLAVDGEFGPATERAVEDYQYRHGLSVDGLVGPATWAQFNADYHLPAYPPPPLRPLRAAVVADICAAASGSEIAAYYWAERGVAPSGYLKGMAFAYATLRRKLTAGDAVAMITAQADQRDPAHDALSWYADQFKACDMDNSRGGVDTLRHVVALMIGLGMRESSGRHCCGRDMSAANVASETAEAGLFQTSWNASACSTDMRRLFDEYNAMGTNAQQSAIDLFDDDVSCSQAEWSCYGSGIGYDYQMLAKAAPQFAVESTALGLRYLRQHWGPINRFEVELRIEADLMLQDIDAIINDDAVAEA